ncbi:MAG: UMP kinase [Pseudomonadota bacterium]
MPETDTSTDLKYRRVLLKVSGEALMGDQAFGIDPDMISQVASDIKMAVARGISVGLVVGGGNIFRGVSLAAGGADRVSADHMGMLGTVMNAIALRMGLEAAGLKAVVMSAIETPEIAESYSQRRALEHLDTGRVVVFAGGTGNPFFTTDTAAALRAAEIRADVLMKATQVDGIYDADPEKNPEAKRFDHINHGDVLARGLKVMDTAAVALTQENDIPIIVFSIYEKGQFADILAGGGRFTLVSNG